MSCIHLTAEHYELLNTFKSKTTFSLPLKLKCNLITVSVCDSHNQTTAEGCSGCTPDQACCGSGNETNPMCQSFNGEQFIQRCHECMYSSTPIIMRGLRECNQTVIVSHIKHVIY